MKTRRSNKTKSYAVHYDYGVDSDEEVPVEDDAAKDANFDVEGRTNGANDGEDGHDGHDGDSEVDNDQLLLDMDEDTEDAQHEDDEDEDKDEDDEKGRDRNQLSRPTHTKPLPHAVDAHQIPPFPPDPKSLHQYTGPLRRWTHFRNVLDLFYGPDSRRTAELAGALRTRWDYYPTLPGKLPEREDSAVCPSPWVPEKFEAEREEALKIWFADYDTGSKDKQRSHAIPAKHVERFLPRTKGELLALMGPFDKQQEVRFSQGKSISLTESGCPIHDSTAADSSHGWMLDVGGMVLSMSWAQAAGHVRQLLALAVIPLSDQQLARGHEEEDMSSADNDLKEGNIQIWEFLGEHDANGVLRPSKRPPRMVTALCFGWGRPKRIQWCPVTLSPGRTRRLLAVLCGDGQVRVLEVKMTGSNNASSSQTHYEWIESPLATLGFADQYSIRATAFTWLTHNRLALGHSDGSITLWSVYPRACLTRHSVCASYIVDLCSGQPSRASLLLAVPVGGSPTALDLAHPSAEVTHAPFRGMAFQAHLLAWNDHLHGWCALFPSSTPACTVLGFLPARTVPQPRAVLIAPSAPTCLALGATHPFLLAGCADGSLWASNIVRRLFQSRSDGGSSPHSRKLKVFEAEFRDLRGSDGGGGLDGPDGPNRQATQPTASVEPLRGAVRILQGFHAETNGNPKTQMAQRTKAEMARAKKQKKQGGNTGKAEEADLMDGDFGFEGSQHLFDKSRAVIQHPLTRITAVEWNPNLEFGWWAAAAMGSGLVRVMDLGVEY